jgi:hypothetical protein
LICTCSVFSKGGRHTRLVHVMPVIFTLASTGPVCAWVLAVVMGTKTVKLPA